MKKKFYVVLAIVLCINFIGGTVFYLKANEKALIRANLKSIIRACNYIGIYPVSEYYKDKSKRKLTLTFTKPEFPSAADYRPPRQSSDHGKVTDYLTYTVTHKEGFSKCQRTYNDSFSMKCFLGNDGVAPQELNENSPVQIYFNGITLKTTLGEGDKTKNLEDPEKGGMSVYNVPDSVSQMNLNVTIRWNKNGKALCSFKGTPFKDLPKTDEKYEVVKPTQSQMPTKEEQWFSSTDGNPLISLKLGTVVWSQYSLAYKGTEKEKVDKKTEQTAESWTAKGKTAWHYY